MGLLSKPRTLLALAPVPLEHKEIAKNEHSPQHPVAHSACLGRSCGIGQGRMDQQQVQFTTLHRCILTSSTANALISRLLAFQVTT